MGSYNLYIPKTSSANGTQSKNSRLYRKLQNLVVGKTYCLSFDMKLKNFTGTPNSSKPLGYAGVSNTTPISNIENNARFDAIKYPTASSYYCKTPEGSFDKKSWIHPQAGIITYNGSMEWLTYEARFVADATESYIYFENYYALADMYVDNITVKETSATSDKITNIKIPAKTAGTTNILVIGNSFGYDTSREICGKEGIINSGDADVRFGLLTSGGKDPDYFYNQISTGTTSMSYSFYDKSQIINMSAGQHVSLDMVKRRMTDNGQKWDYILVQAATMYNYQWYIHPDVTTTTQTYKNLIKELEKRCSKSKIVIYGTWACTDDYIGKNSGQIGYSTQDEMHKACMDTFDKLSKETGKKVLNIEEIFEEIRNDSALKLPDGKLNRDGYHLNGTGSMVAGLAVYEYFTGVDVTNLDYDKLTHSNNTVTGYDSTITTEQLKKLKSIVHKHTNSAISGNNLKSEENNATNGNTNNNNNNITNNNTNNNNNKPNGNSNNTAKPNSSNDTAKPNSSNDKVKPNGGNSVIVNGDESDNVDNGEIIDNGNDIVDVDTTEKNNSNEKNKSTFFTKTNGIIILCVLIVLLAALVVVIYLVATDKISIKRKL